MSLTEDPMSRSTLGQKVIQSFKNPDNKIQERILSLIDAAASIRHCPDGECEEYKKEHPDFHVGIEMAKRIINGYFHDVFLNVAKPEALMSMSNRITQTSYGFRLQLNDRDHMEVFLPLGTVINV